MFNFENNGILRGILVDDPVIITNRNKSRKTFVTIMTDDGEKITCEGYIPAGKVGTGPYGIIKKGEFVTVAYTIRNKSYAGVSEHLVAQIEKIQLDNRLKKNLQTDAEPETIVESEEQKLPPRILKTVTFEIKKPDQWDEDDQW